MLWMAPGQKMTESRENSRDKDLDRLDRMDVDEREDRSMNSSGGLKAAHPAVSGELLPECALRVANSFYFFTYLGANNK